MLSFRDLADALPAVAPDTPLAALPVGISRPTETDSAFVEPTLTVREGDLESAKVILVAAPAAVGKSVFANAIAADRGTLLWNLGEFPVGSGSFLGKLTESHGIGALSSITKELTNGRYCVVLDALDEGYSLARSDNFEGFVLDLAKQVEALAPRGPAIVACGRTDTIDVTNLLLTDSGLDVCVTTLDFFSPAAAQQFVDLQLDKAGHTAHRTFRVPFEAARDALFERVKEAVSTDDEAGDIDPQSFLGYAPVLVALAGYLRVGDYQALHQELGVHIQPDSSHNGLWAFLQGIVVDLLKREQPKLVENLPTHVQEAIPSDFLGDLYSPSEQCARLLARVAHTPPPSVDLPPAVLPEYEKSVNETLGEHPFVGAGPEGFASVVFRDYVLAQALAAQVDGSAARRIARTHSFKPSPLLLRFFWEYAKGDQIPLIDVEDIDLLYASAHAEEAGERSASLAVEQNDSGLDVEVITTRGDLMEFTVRQAADRLPIGPRVARADLRVPAWKVEIGPPGAEALVGPDVTIECDHILISVTSLRITGRDANDAVIWKARTIEHAPGEFHLAGADHERLKIMVAEPPQFPWTGFVSTDQRELEGDQQSLIDAVRELKNLATRFKPGPVSGNAPVLPVRITEVLVARHRISPEMYSYALDTGLITVAGKSCQLHPQQFGMNIVDLRAQRLTPAVEQYLADYLHRDK
jgi:hypothetical protein